MVRTNFVLERAAAKAEFKKPQSVFSCAHKDRRVFWREVLHGDMWSQPKKHASQSTKIHKEPYYEHLRSKAKKRSGCQLVNVAEPRISRWLLPPEINALRKAIDKSRSI